MGRKHPRRVLAREAGRHAVTRCRPANCKVTHKCALYWPTDKPWPKGVPLMDGIAVTRIDYAIWPITCVFFQDKEKRES